MRHRVSSHVLFKSLVQSLFTHGTIQTSEAKAKAIKGLVDKVINSAKNKKNYSLGLTKETLLKLQNRTSGYTSLVKLGKRVGDQAMIVKMSLIGAESIKPVEKKESRIKNKQSLPSSEGKELRKKTKKVVKK